jgi:hypothetical protein
MATATTSIVSSALSVLLAAGTLSAADRRDVRRAALQKAEKHGPTVVGSLPSKVNIRLRGGYRSALRRVHRLTSCQDLFARLGADGVEVLAGTTYTPARARWEKQVCDSADAFTTVGGSRVWVCNGLGWLSEDSVALILIHEALHGAGLGEQPIDPNGPTPAEIDRMVMKGCDLRSASIAR